MQRGIPPSLFGLYSLFFFCLFWISVSIELVCVCFFFSLNVSFPLPFCNPNSKIVGTVLNVKTAWNPLQANSFMLYEVFWVHVYEHCYLASSSLEIDWAFSRMFYDTITCYQWTRLPIECSKQVFWEHSAMFKVCCYPCPNLSEKCCGMEFRTSIYLQKSIKVRRWIITYIVFVLFSIKFLSKRIGTFLFYLFHTMQPFGIQGCTPSPYYQLFLMLQLSLELSHNKATSALTLCCEPWSVSRNGATRAVSVEAMYHPLFTVR